MQLYKLETSDELGKAAAGLTAEYINNAIQKNGEARIVLSTGASQFDTLKYLVKEEIDWSRVTGFHLDEYVGLSITHPASFIKYLKERFVNLVHLKEFNFVSGEGNPNDTISSLTVKLREKPIDVALIGIGENCHIAFNDPPCDIETKKAYHVVALDKKCRAQQVGEGWYKSISEVPERAISMTVYEILQAKAIISAVPYKVKADAVYHALKSELSPLYPATYLRTHKDWHLFLDKDSAALI